MPPLTAAVYIVLGLVLLVVGAELLVRGASRIAIAWGMPPLIIGLTIVAYGTSSPEAAVSIQSGLAGQADIALGNVVGSNICNVLLILGVSALIAPMMVPNQLIRLDVPIMIGVSLLVFLFGLDGNIGRSDGVILFLGAIAYTLFLILNGRDDQVELPDNLLEASASQRARSRRASLMNLGLVAVSLGLLVWGSHWLVKGAVLIAQAIGVDELVIGLTIVAVGTSLPELASSVVASMRGEQDIAVGNVVGSNIFNILAVLGLAAALAPNGMRVSPAAINFDIPVMIAVAVGCLPIFITGKTVSRWEGLLFLGYYVAYTAYLILDSANHATLPLFNHILLLFVIPLTVIMLVISLLRSLRQKRRPKADS
ncbi:calcium/sodium antiporter [Trichothermofontia sp.]